MLSGEERRSMIGPTSTGTPADLVLFDGEQVFRIVIDEADVREALLIDTVFKEQIRKSDDGRQRRSYLVTDLCQEG